VEAVAFHGWGTDRSVAQLLFAEGWRFELYQAVRLLERMAQEGAEKKTPVGEGQEPDREAVRFLSRVGFDFPASEVQGIELPQAEGDPVRMTVNALGLAGALGPLPAPFSEHLLQRVAAKDTAFRDFLDIFNHRLVSILYRAKKRHRAGLAWDRPDREPFARTAFSLMGLGTPGLHHRMDVEDRALLQYTGVIARRARSIVGLEIILADYFGVGVRSTQMLGRWLEIGEDQRTAIGARLGRNHELTAVRAGAVLGSHIWDQQAAFELCLGPLSLGQFLDFLPIGGAHRSLAQLVRFYAGDEKDCTVRLTLKAAEVPPCRLGAAPRLGWSSWLRTKPFAADDSQVRLRVGHAP
jgi:type VI secretion system protein ImpH